MHDLMYANKIICFLRENVSAQDRGKRIVVNVMLGPFTHVTVDSLKAAFGAVLAKEDFGNVELCVKKNEVSIKCKKCGFISKSAEPLFSCSVCNCPDFDILSAEEFVIQSIEIK
ncbi:MAG: hydrogenase maturation nickel metallochaperone HypA [Candidatus Omnitrophica bacterium]|jgi:Zn finger protein HypA/HybF involved in hydrogenase expression|nr:hydrogenase maturation nickel metallochaperone HypA [Candidatus Omnitrophota bacterium]